MQTPKARYHKNVSSYGEVETVSNEQVASSISYKEFITIPKSEAFPPDFLMKAYCGYNKQGGLFTDEDTFTEMLTYHKNVIAISFTLIHTSSLNIFDLI